MNGKFPNSDPIKVLAPEIHALCQRKKGHPEEIG